MLNKRLERLQEQMINGIPDDILLQMQAAIEEIVENKSFEDIPKKGDICPDFSIYLNKKKTTINHLLKKGPVILNFFRGSWCPFCSLELDMLNQKKSKLNRYKTKIISISSQKESLNSILRKKYKGIIVITDKHSRIAKKFNLDYKIPAKYRKALKGLSLDIDYYHESDELPISASYLVGKDRRILYSYVNIDFTQRAEPADLIKILKGEKI